MDVLSCLLTSEIASLVDAGTDRPASRRNVHRLLLRRGRSLLSAGNQSPTLRLEDVVRRLGWRGHGVLVVEVVQRAHAPAVFGSGSATVQALRLLPSCEVHFARRSRGEHLREVVAHSHDSSTGSTLERHGSPRDVSRLEFLEVLDSFRASGAPESLCGEHRILVVLIHRHDQVVQCLELLL